MSIKQHNTKVGIYNENKKTKKGILSLGYFVFMEDNPLYSCLYFFFNSIRQLQALASFNRERKREKKIVWYGMRES